MKKLLWLLPVVWLVVALLCVNAQASPYLVCDVTQDVVNYIVDMDGVVTTGVPVQLGWIKANTLYLTDPGGTTTQCHVLRDLATLPVGTHTVQAKGDFGLWGVSDEWSVPLVFPRPTLTAPQGERLVK